MSQKKMVGRNVAIALGVICIVLVVVSGVMGVLMVSMTNNNTTTLNDKDSQIATLENQVANLTDILGMYKSDTWADNQAIIQSANTYQSWSFSGNYAGYVSVWVHSNEAQLYIRATYSNYFDNQTASSNLAIFPMLPSISIQIFVGNTSPDGMSGTVTITYYY